MSGDDKKDEFRPKFFEMLDEADQEKYRELRMTLSSQMCRNRRGKRLETFGEMLGAIKNFCIRNDDNDWKRCLVCGVCFFPTGIGINNRQLSILINKCKSSINGSLQKMGYTAMQSRNESSESLTKAIPILKDNFNELREWTVRLYVAATPQPHLPLYNVNTMYQYHSPMPNQYQSYGMYGQQPQMMQQMPQQKMQAAPKEEPVPEIPERPKTEEYWDEFCLPPVFMEDQDQQKEDGDGLLFDGYNDSWS